jgi:hypothetical protein
MYFKGEISCFGYSPANFYFWIFDDSRNIILHTPAAAFRNDR